MKNFLKGPVSALLLAVVTTYPAIAQEFTDEHLAVARETMIATKSTQFFDGILPTMAEEVRDTFIRVDPGITPVIEEKTLEAALELTARRKELDDRFVRLWASEFTIEELTTIRDFLTSPSGEKFVNISSAITQTQSQLASEWTSELSSSFVALVRRKLREAGYQL